MFIPKVDNKYPYPEDTSSHYLVVKKNRGINFDKDYPYADYSKGFAFKRFWVRFLLVILVFPILNFFKTGLRIKGKKNLKKYKDIIKGGAVTISNHIHMWDYICVMKALHGYKWPYLLAWDQNVNGGSGPLVRMVGGIPIPLNNKEATVAFSKAVNKVLNDHNLLHIYAEGSMWEYYVPIRPFKSGAASLAIKNNKPIIPMAFSYRKPSWFRAKILRQPAALTLNIGEPIFPNEDLEKAEQLDDLTVRAHESICHLAGLDNNNIYSAIYDHSKKLD